MRRRPPVSTRPYTLFPYTTLFRAVTLGTHKHGVWLNGVDSCPLILEDETQFASQVNELQPDVIVHTAGLTSVDGCEANPSLANHAHVRSEEHTSELQSLMRISYAVFCLKKKHTKITHIETRQ